REGFAVEPGNLEIGERLAVSRRGGLEEGRASDRAAGMGSAELVHERLEPLITHQSAHFRQDKHSFTGGDVVPLVGAQISVRVRKCDVLAPTSSNRRQVSRRRQEKIQRKPLAVANSELPVTGT